MKTYILDTNILLKSPLCIYGFDDNDVCVTEVTIEELDFKKKNGDSEVQYNARCALREINKLRKMGKLTEGVKLSSGGMFRVIGLDNENVPELPKGWKTDKADNIMLLTVECYMSHSDSECIFITNDTNLQIKADCRGISVEDYNNERLDDNIELYTGRKELFVNDSVIDELYKKEDVDEGISITEIGEFYDIKNNLIDPDFYENEFIVLHSLSAISKTILLKYRNGKLKRLQYDQSISDIKPLNTGQRFALDALLTPADEIPLVILQGQAGTAKTFLSLVAGLNEVIDKNSYKRVLMCRPNSKFDDDIGYLKGTEMDKIGPLIRPFYDNLEVILELKGTDFKDIPEIIDSYFYMQYIKAEAMAYMRGRSITNTFIIVDEAQNATPNQILGMITRAGKGSKIVIIGDPNQIDEVKLDKRNNGLVYATEKMKDSKYAASLTFENSECKRSPLALEAAQLLTNPKRN